MTERRTSEDYVVLEELLQPTMDEMDAIASRGGLLRVCQRVSPTWTRSRTDSPAR